MFSMSKCVYIKVESKCVYIKVESKRVYIKVESKCVYIKVESKCVYIKVWIANVCTSCQGMNTKIHTTYLTSDQQK